MFWNENGVEDWTLGSYLLMLVYPGLCYVGATILVPADASAQPDWHTYFFSIRKVWFAVAAIATSSNLAILVSLRSLPLISPGGLLSMVFVGLYLAGFLLAGELVQKLIVLVNAALVVAAYAPVIYTPLGS
jgi:hypothetical protein